MTGVIIRPADGVKARLLRSIGYVDGCDVTRAARDVTFAVTARTSSGAAIWSRPVTSRHRRLPEARHEELGDDNVDGVHGVLPALGHVVEDRMDERVRLGVGH